MPGHAPPPGRRGDEARDLGQRHAVDSEIDHAARGGRQYPVTDVHRGITD